MDNLCISRKKTVRLRVPMHQFKQWMEESIQTYVQTHTRQTLTVQSARKLVQYAFQSGMRRKYSFTGEIHLEQYPLMSLEASGKWRDDDLGMMVYVPAGSKRRAYCRKWFIPANPRSAIQQEHRILFKDISSQWKQESDAVKDAWRIEARKYSAMNGHNLYVKKCFEIFKETQVCPTLGFMP